MQRTISFIAAAAIAVTGSAAGFAPAVAAPLTVPAVVAEAPAAEIQLVGSRDRGWHRGDRDGRYWRHGKRHFRHFDGDHRRHGRYYRHHRHYRHGNDNFGAAAALGVFGLAAGAILGSQLGAGGGGGGSWAAACDRKYNSFDYRSGTYLGYDGHRHRCRLP